MPRNILPFLALLTASIFTAGIVTASSVAASPGAPHGGTPKVSGANEVGLQTGGPIVSAAAVVAIQQLVRGNDSFVAAHDPEYFAQFSTAEHPAITLVTCSDSRIHTRDLLAEPNGKIFTVRNIGNQITNNAGSVEYGVHHLVTPVLLIMGHLGCGAIKAALGDYADESPAIRGELDGLHLPLRSARRDSATVWADGVLLNVHAQVAVALKSFHDEVEQGTLVVVGAVYDFQDKPGPAGKVSIININGERDKAALALSPFLERVELGGAKQVAVGHAAH